MACHGPISAVFWPILSHLGQSEPIFGLFWPIMGLFQLISTDFRPILGSLDLDLGHLGPISWVWAWILAIKGLILSIWRVWTSIWAILDVFREFGPRFRALRAYLEEAGPGLGPFRANFLESEPGFGQFSAYCGGLGLDLGLFLPISGVQQPKWDEMDSEVGA